jgi:hypothetical protein
MHVLHSSYRTLQSPHKNGHGTARHLPALTAVLQTHACPCVVSLGCLCFHTNLSTHWPDDNQLSAVTTKGTEAVFEPVTNAKHREKRVGHNATAPDAKARKQASDLRRVADAEDAVRTSLSPRGFPWHKSNLLYYDALQHQVLVVWFITCFKMGDVQLAVSTWYCRGSVTVHTRQTEEVVVPRSEWPLNRRVCCTVHPS